MRPFSITSLAFLCAIKGFAGPISLDEVSSQAKWAVHIDATRLRNTELGRQMLARTDSEEARIKMDAFRAMVNFDPSKDLDSLTLYGKDGGNHSAVAILHGRFDGEHLAVLARANDTYQSVEHAGITVHSWESKQGGQQQSSRRTYGCIFDSGTLVFSGNVDALTHAVDVLGGKAAGLTANASLAGLLSVDDRYFVSAAGLMAGMKEVNPRATLLRNTESAVIAIGEKDAQLEAAVELTTASADAALNLSKMLDGMIGMAMLNAEGAPAMAKLAAGTSLSVDGSVLAMTMKLPVATIMAYLDQAKRKPAGEQ